MSSDTEAARACLGPVPPGERPTFDIPPGACDTHVHVFGPYADYPLSDNRSYTAPEATAQTLLHLMDSLGLSRAVIVNATAYGTDSGALVAALRTNRKRFRGVAVLGPETTDAELDRLHAAGVRGIRLNLFRRNGAMVYRNGADLTSLDALGPRLAERGWHVQVWVNVADLPELQPRFAAYPLDIVIDHMGRIEADKDPSDPNFALLCSLLRNDRYWCKLCGADRLTLLGPPYRDIDRFARALIDANVDRLVWGSDWPHVAYFDDRVPRDAELLSLMGRWTADPQVRRKILVDNPAKLYDFD